VIAGRVAASVVQRQVRYVTPVPAAAATGLVSAVYRQVADELRLVVPPALLHSPSPDVLAGYWMLTREPLMPAGAVDRATKETVAAAVSVANICPYCVDMHSVGMYDLCTEQDAEAVVSDRLDEIADPGLRAVAAWARVAHRPDDPLVRRPPFPAGARPELVGTVVGFHYLTRMVNVFLANFLLPPGLGPRARRRFKRGVSRVLRPTLREAREPGRAVGLLPAAAVPATARWALASPTIAAAVARSFAAFEAAGARALPVAVRELVRTRLAGWRGEEPGLSRQWCEDLVAGLPEEDRPAGRLALLTAFASYQVDDDVVREFRHRHPADPSLVDATAWASFAAAERVGTFHSPAG
jgi:hypothetical protein